MLSSSLQHLSGIGPKKALVLKEEAGLGTIEDLLFYTPRRYLDRSTIKRIIDCFVNDQVTIFGKIVHVSENRRGRPFLEVTIDDGSDTLSGIFFGGIPYFKKLFTVGEPVSFAGTIGFFRNKQIVHPEFDFFGDEPGETINTGRLVPLYPSSEKLRAAGFDSRGFRRMIRKALEICSAYLIDPFDDDLRRRYSLMPFDRALKAIHFPESPEQAETARRRLSFNEIYYMQYYLGLSKKYLRREQRSVRQISPETWDACRDRLPFRLTADQVKAIADIAQDLEQSFPMNRLLQGDVGSGKTLVAIAASILACGRGDQVAIMAPTEILAAQHYETFQRLASDAGKITLLTGSTPIKMRNNIEESIASGEIGIVIGTHALIQESVRFKRLGLVIVDEQHRFGVNQRARLRGKGTSPDLLVMTATPIPRSLALTLYGDLDVSLIRELPAGRVPIQTMAFPVSRLTGVYNSIEKYLSQGRQVYYVLPLIEESESADLKSAISAYDHLRTTIFPHRRIALLHGKMPNVEKTAVMHGFKEGSIDILVSTTVIEVGVDVPNASVIIIEHAERFGLSQLHQLRGRVGRGIHQSFCILIYPDETPPASRERIEILTRTADGFIIAEEDLRFRGAGEIIGTRQHGESAFEFADLGRDLDLIMAARDEAMRAIDNIEAIPERFDRLELASRFSELIRGIRANRILAILS